jgi:Ring finger domain
MNYVQLTPGLGNGASDFDNIPPLLEASDYSGDEGGSESDGASFVSALVQPNAINPPQTALASSPSNEGRSQPSPSGSRDATATSRIIGDEMPALMSCSSSEDSDEYTDSEGDVRNDTNPRPNEESATDERRNEANSFEDDAGDFVVYDDVEGLYGLFPPSWTANANIGNAPLSPLWDSDVPENVGTLEDMDNMFDLLLGPSPNFTHPQNVGNNRSGEDRAKKLLDALEVVDEVLLERFFMLKAGSGEDGRGCAVCYEDLKVLLGEVVALPCAHVFHQNCLQPWFQNHSSCPSCRFDLDPGR